MTLDQAVASRFPIFLFLLLLFAVAERVWPRRKLVSGRLKRWFANLGLLGLSVLLMRLLIPVGAVGAALWAEQATFGVFHFVEAPLWLSGLICILLLDLAIYLQHLAMHHVPLLWRLHHVHHLDRDLDVSSGVRFHPAEIFISVIYKMIIIALLGVPAIVVVMFEIILNAMALFNHSNTALPHWLDRVLRLVVVTPDVHRVHHSTAMSETNSNFGFNIVWWDWIFKTYQAQPIQNHNTMVLGLETAHDVTPDSLKDILIEPIRFKS